MERPATVGCSPSKRTRRIHNGTRSTAFWPSDKPSVTDINKGRKPATPERSTASPCALVGGERGALSESVLADRPTVKKIVDRITASGKQSYVRKVLRSYDTCKTGFLSKDDLRSAMDRLALGLDDTEKNKVVARLDPDNSNRIPVNHLVTSFEEDFEPLGWSHPTDRRLATLTRPPFNSMRRCITPCGMSTKMAQDFSSTNSFVCPQSSRRRSGGSKFRDLPPQQAGMPLAVQLGIGAADVKAALQAPETFALQQQLFFKGAGASRHSMFSAHDASRTGRLHLEDLTRCCQAISPGLKPRDVAALAAAVDPSSTGFVDYKQFVGSLVESAPAHEKLLSTGKLGHETQHEKWGTSPITRPSPPISPSARFPTARSPSSGRGDLFASSLPRSQSAAVGTRAGSYVSDAMLGTGKDFKYGQPDVFDAQGEVDERKLMHAVGVVPMLRSLASVHSSPKARGPRHRFAFLSTSMPELPQRPYVHTSGHATSSASGAAAPQPPQPDCSTGDAAAISPGLGGGPSTQADACRGLAGSTLQSGGGGGPQPGSASMQVEGEAHGVSGTRSPPPPAGAPTSPPPGAPAPAVPATAPSGSEGPRGIGRGGEAQGPMLEGAGAGLEAIPGGSAALSAAAAAAAEDPGRRSPSRGDAVGRGQLGTSGSSTTARQGLGVPLGSSKSRSAKMPPAGGPSPYTGQAAAAAVDNKNEPGSGGDSGRVKWTWGKLPCEGGGGGGRGEAGSEIGPAECAGEASGMTATALYTQSKRHDRFAHLKHPGTSHTVQPLPGTALFLEPCAQFVRKGDEAYMPYQAEDKQRKAKLAHQKAQAATDSCRFVAERVARDEAQASFRDAANLEALGAAKQQYAENLHNLDILRSMDTRRIGTHFGHGFGKSVLKEHLDSAAFFNRT